LSSVKTQVVDVVEAVAIEEARADFFEQCPN
jgi:hypothetical protein